MTTPSGSLLGKLLARAASLRFDVLILILSAVFVASDALAGIETSAHVHRWDEVISALRTMPTGVDR